MIGISILDKQNSFSIFLYIISNVVDDLRRFISILNDVTKKSKMKKKSSKA